MDILHVTAQVAPDMLQVLAILLDTTVTGYAVDREDLTRYWKSENKPHFSTKSKILLFAGFSKTLPTTNTGTTDETFQKNKIPPYAYFRECMKVQTHSS